MNSSFSKKLGLVSVVFFVLNGLPYEGKAWGFFMHKKINSHAIYLLPPELITLYKNNEFTLKVYATKPDNRRYIDPKEGPRHFIDLDTYVAIDSGFIGLKYSAANDLYNQCVEDHHDFGQDGILPWHCLLMMNQLTEAMKDSRLEDILRISGELGHYISDAHVPLHTTHNYNGQRSGQYGIHGLWESTIPELEFEQYDYWIDEKLSYWENPLEKIWSIILDSHNMLFSVFSAEYCV
ncbi:MAG: zinc dependent phospholipase C family protein, partial [Bacteroidota bacterium]|nr:zinc dependent phospholipase C family protein [Bacteroidota bacterium]